MTRRPRTAAYGIGRTLGDWNAVVSGKPSKVIKRLANKWVGRHIVSKVWFR